MKKIIILGNGFDLAHGLKTSYEDFIKYIIDLSINCDKDVRRDLIDVGGLNAEYQNYNEIRQKFVKNFIYGKIRFNNQFFKNSLEKYFESEWLNIEEHYFRALGHASDSGVKILQSEFEIIKKYLERYLTSISGEKTPIIKGFNKIFLEGDPNSLIFLNFNYTSTIAAYIEYLKLIKEIKIINIHGELNSENNPIVFGYGDDSSPNYDVLIKKNNNAYLRNLKRQQYNLAEEYEKLHEEMNQMLTRKEEVEIYSIGHSLGLTDKTLLREVLEHPKVNKIKLVYYMDIEGYRNLNDNIRRIVQGKTFRKIVSYPKSSKIPQAQNWLNII